MTTPPSSLMNNTSDKIFVLFNGSLMTLEQYKEMVAEEQ